MSSRKGTKAWRKNISITDVEDSIEKQSKDQMAGGAVESKPSEELFKIDTTPSSDVVVRTQTKLRVDEILAERSQVPAVCKYAKAEVSKQKRRQASDQVLRQAKKVKLNKPAVTQAMEGEDIWSKEYAPTVKVPKTVRSVPSVTKLPAIERVIPGQSYNPDYVSHQKVLQESTDVELEIQKNKADLAANAPSSKIITRNHNADAHFTMDIVLDEEDEDEDALAVVDDIQKKVLDSKPKTQTEKNRRNRHKLLQLQHGRHRQQKKLDNSFIEAENDSAQSVLSERRLRLKQQAVLIKRREANEPKQLSKYKYSELPVALKLTDELPQNLRTLTPEQSPFKERFSSLQKRNLIEVRQPILQQRRYRLRGYEIHSYKKFT